MFVYLVRHAIATAREATDGRPDAERELTEKGISRMRRSVRTLDRLNLVFDEIWTSPYRRAAQTAELVAEMPSFDGPTRVVDELRPGGDVNRLALELQKSLEKIGIALVGHEPDLGHLATQLVGGQSRNVAAFKKGGVACIELDEDSRTLQGQIRWLLTPRQMRMIR